MNILFAASEAAPYIKTGGLGDVAQALPEALSENKNTNVYVFLPYYKSVKNNPAIETEFVKSFAVNLSWRVQHVGVFKLKNRRRKLQFYFIDNEYYFGRDEIYGCMDDGERFAYFSKAILEAVVQLGLRIDVFHCNDWQTALIPPFLHYFYESELGQASTAFTIHNIEYQGKCSPYFLGDVLGFDASMEPTMMYGDCINFMKGAILTADAVTTVSRTYAQEICYPYYAHGLDKIIAEHSFKLLGIVNGIDTTVFDPETDSKIYRHYGIADRKEGKTENKTALQKELGLPVKQVPVVGMVSRLVEHKGIALLLSVMEEFVRFDMQLIILGSGDKKLEDGIRYFADKYPDKVSLTTRFDPALSSKIYAASDMFLMPSKSEPCGLSQLIAMRYGSVPVVNCTGGLKDTVEAFNPETETGTGFNFQSFTADDLLGALRRAFELYGGSPDKFDRLTENCMNNDCSWENSSKEYLSLYTMLCEQSK